MTDIIRYVVGFVCLVFSLGCLVTNVAVLTSYLLRGQRGSTIPLLGGAAGAAGIATLPIANIHSYWWIPLVVEPGFGIWLLFSLSSLLTRWIGTDKPGSGRRSDD